MRYDRTANAIQSNQANSYVEREYEEHLAYSFQNCKYCLVIELSRRWEFVRDETKEILRRDLRGIHLSKL